MSSRGGKVTVSSLFSDFTVEGDGSGEGDVTVKEIVSLVSTLFR